MMKTKFLYILIPSLLLIASCNNSHSGATSSTNSSVASSNSETITDISLFVYDATATIKNPGYTFVDASETGSQVTPESKQINNNVISYTINTTIDCVSNEVYHAQRFEIVVTFVSDDTKEQTSIYNVSFAYTTSSSAAEIRNACAFDVSEPNGPYYIINTNNSFSSITYKITLQYNSLTHEAMALTVNATIASSSK